LDVGVYHDTGKRYNGHYDPWLEHQISQLMGDIAWSKTILPSCGYEETDPLQFAQTSEQFGIVDIPLTLKTLYDHNRSEIITSDTEFEWPGIHPRLSHIYPMKLHLSHLRGK